MSFQSENKMTNGTKSSRLRLPLLRGAPLLAVAVSLLSYWVTAARALTLVDPQVEDSTTHFGQSVAVIGDVTGDGVPDLVVGGPFRRLR